LRDQTIAVRAEIQIYTPATKMAAAARESLATEDTVNVIAARSAAAAQRRALHRVMTTGHSDDHWTEMTTGQLTVVKPDTPS